MAFWGVVTTHPQAEAKAALNLKRQGFETYAPRYLDTSIRHGCRIERIRFLFPRYLFVRIIDRWWSILGTFGVSQLLRTADKPAVLSDGWIETMRARETEGVVILPKERYRRGERVQITSGALQGLFGLYQGMTSQQREVVLLDALGTVHLAAGDLD